MKCFTKTRKMKFSLGYFAPVCDARLACHPQNRSNLSSSKSSQWKLSTLAFEVGLSSDSSGSGSIVGGKKLAYSSAVGTAAEGSAEECGPSKLL